MYESQSGTIMLPNCGEPLDCGLRCYDFLYTNIENVRRMRELQSRFVFEVLCILNNLQNAHIHTHRNNICYVYTYLLFVYMYKHVHHIYIPFFCTGKQLDRQGRLDDMEPILADASKIHLIPSKYQRMLGQSMWLNNKVQT